MTAAVRHPVLARATAADALSALRGFPGDAAVILVDGEPARVRVATMTAFGPSLWSSPKLGARAAADILADLHRRGRRAYLHAASGRLMDEVVDDLAARRVPASRPATPPDADVGAALARFMAREADVPVTRTVEGSERTGAWAVAAYDGRPDPVPGDRLRLEALWRDGSTVLRWRHASGMDVGVALVVPRASLTEAEARIVAEGWAEVTRLTYGLAPLEDGRELRTRVTMLDVPRSLLTAFPDGIRPRYGLFVEDHA